MSERALYLEGGGEPLFAVHHAPGSPERAREAVVIVPPYGWDETATHRARREWALHLVAEGRHVLRLDLPGTGDSPGTLTDDGRWESWARAVARAADWLRAEAGAPRVCAVAIGAGGYPAFAAAADGSVDDLVLWATPPRGTRFLRELSAFARLEASRIAESGGPPSPEPADGIEAGGYVLPEAFAEEVRAVDLEASTLPGSARVLLLDRDGSGAADALADRLRSGGATVEQAEGRGYAAMVMPPDLSHPPRETFALVSQWLERCGDGPSSPARAPADAVAAALDLGAVRERPFEAGDEGRRLRGILAEPVAADAPAPLALVFLNAGAIRRIGPNRLWVRAARRWAERGVPSLRLDNEGIGDADGDGDVYEEVGRFHDPHLVDRIGVALDSLAELGVAQRFVLIGLCSGGHWAFKTALRDDRVAAAVLVNTRILYWHEHIDRARDLRRTRLLVRPVTWKRLLRGDVPLHRWRGFAAWAASSVASRARRRRAEPSVFEWQARMVSDGFTELREAGCSAHFVFCDGEPLRDELTAAGLLAQPDRWPNVAVTTIPGREHTLKPVWMHPHAEAALDAIVRRELARAPAPSGVA